MRSKEREPNATRSMCEPLQHRPIVFCKRTALGELPEKKQKNSKEVTRFSIFLQVWICNATIAFILNRPLGLCRLRTIKYRSKERESNATRGMCENLQHRPIVFCKRTALGELPERKQKK